MTRVSFVCSLILGLAACGGGGVTHPETGKPNTDKYCASGAPEEQNCMACASKPGCGFCNDAKDGAPVCQPGTNEQTTSNGCNTPLIVTNEECPAPPPAEAAY